MTPMYIAVHVEKFTDLRKMQKLRKNLMYRHWLQIYFAVENAKRHMMSFLRKTVRWLMKANIDDKVSWLPEKPITVN